MAAKEDNMNLHSTKTIVWTAALIMFLSVAIASHLEWRILVVPGALLTWYGLVAPAPRRRIPVQKTMRSGLN